MPKLKNGHLRTWIEIDGAAARANLRVFRQAIGSGTKLMAVVKSNAYGHSLIDFAKLMARAKADWLGVDSVTEAAALRREKIRQPVLVFGHTRLSNFPLAAREKISLSVSTLEDLESVIKFSKKLSRERKLKIHLKLDTGMHRQGFLPDDWQKVLKKLETRPAGLLVEGVYSHLAAPNLTKFAKFTRGQIKLFAAGSDQLAKLGTGALRHLAATGGTLAWPEAHFDLVRIGLGLYGYGHWEARSPSDLRPILTWKTIISELKTVPAGETVGYDCTEKLKRLTRLAVCPIGYWHGYPRLLSGRGEVLVRGKRCRVLGRVSMDMITIDVTDVPGARVGEEVTLIGCSGKEIVTADDLATKIGTTCYEILTRINPLIKRFYR